MKRLILIIFLIIFLFSGLYIYKEARLKGAGVPVIRYHRVAPRRALGLREPLWFFDLQMRYLKWRGYQTVSLNDVVEYVEKGKRLPRRSMVITFDDGYEDNYFYAEPVLRKYGFKATIFVVVNGVGGTNFWDEGSRAPRLRMLSWQEIKRLQKRGVDIESHTLNHRHTIMTLMTEEELRREILGSRVILEEKLGRPVRFLSYPYGEMNPRLERIVKESGYRGAVSVQDGGNGKNVDVYDLKRIRIQGRDGFSGFLDFLWFAWRF
ncbi:MAG: polysaccharide deacetylase family protein [Actinomycetota bacterium]